MSIFLRFAWGLVMSRASSARLRPAAALSTHTACGGVAVSLLFAAQLNVGSIDPSTGIFVGKYETYAIAGYVRNKAESDMAMTELVRK